MNTRYLLLALTVAAAMACDKKKVEPTAPLTMSAEQDSLVMVEMLNLFKKERDSQLVMVWLLPDQKLSEWDGVDTFSGEADESLNGRVRRLSFRNFDVLSNIENDGYLRQFALLVARLGKLEQVSFDVSFEVIFGLKTSVKPDGAPYIDHNLEVVRGVWCKARPELKSYVVNPFIYMLEEHKNPGAAEHSRFTLQMTPCQ